MGYNPWGWKESVTEVTEHIGMQKEHLFVKHQGYQGSVLYGRAGVAHRPGQLTFYVP